METGISAIYCVKHAVQIAYFLYFSPEQKRKHSNVKYPRSPERGRINPKAERHRRKSQGIDYDNFSCHVSFAY